MPRKGRIDFPGALHHVIIRGINRSSIFMDDDDRRAFISRLARGIDKTKVSCLAWALIPNHVHLLLQTGPHPLTGLMRSLLTGYALYFNKRHHRVGYLFQNRYKSILVDKKIYLIQLVRYIHLNPLRAGLVPDISRLNTYPWSGHSTIIGIHPVDWQDTESTLYSFGKRVGDARKKYLKFVAKGVTEGRREDLTGGGLLRSFGGWEGVLELKSKGKRWRGDERILGDSDFVENAMAISKEQLTRKEMWKSQGWDLDSLMEYVEEISGVHCKNIIGKIRDHKTSKARSLFTWWAIEELGYSATSISKFCNISLSSVLNAAKRGGIYIKNQHLMLPAKKLSLKDRPLL